MARRPTKPPETASLSEIPADMMTPAIRAQIEAAKAQIEAATAAAEAASTIKEVAEEQKKEVTKKEFKEKASKVTEKDLRITYPALAKLIKAAIAEKESSKSSKEAAQDSAKLDDLNTKIENSNINLSTLIGVQRESNKALGEILKTLVDIKKEGSLKKESSVLEDLADAAAGGVGGGGGKGKQNAPKTKPGVGILKRLGGGIGGLLGGFALDYTSDKLRESGHEKLAAGASVGSSALAGAGLGSLFGPVGTAVGGLAGGAYGIYKNWNDITSGQSASIKELEAKSSAGQMTQGGGGGGARSSVFPTPKASTERGTGAPSALPPPGGGIGDYTGKGVAASGSAKEAIDFFEGKGWTKAQAIGIAANLEVESKFKTNAVGDGGKAYGIAQWHPDRQRKFQEIYGKSIREAGFKEQLEFVNWELNNTESKAGNIIRQAQNAGQAAAAVDQHYERSSGIHRQIRISTAQKYEKGEGLTAEKTEAGAKSSGGGGSSAAPTAQSPVTPGVGAGRGSGELEMAQRNLDAVKEQYGKKEPTEEQKQAEADAGFKEGSSAVAGYEASLSTAPVGSGRGDGGAEMIARAQAEYDEIAAKENKKVDAEKKTKEQKAPAEVGEIRKPVPGIPNQLPPNFQNVYGNMMGGMTYGGGMMRPPVVARTFPGGGMPGVPNLNMLGGMLGGRLGGRGGGLFGAIAGGLLQEAMSQNGNRLASSSTADQMYQRAPRQVIMQSQGGGNDYGRLPKPTESNANPDNFVGNVEPVDAAKRFKHLFGISA